MGRKFSNISEVRQYIDNSNSAFRSYLKEKLPKDIWSLITAISQDADVYVFSGVIRNFFIEDEQIRDLDLVLNKEIEIERRFEKYQIAKNSYGGYKITVGDLNIDLWYLMDTWTVKTQGMFNFYLAEYVSRTAFFNFSAIVYSIGANEFYYTNEFVNFLKDNKIDVVNEMNPNYPLSIVNSFYYSDKYGFPIGKRLKQLIVNVYEVDMDFEKVQQKHFGKIMYYNSQVEKRIMELWSEL